MRVPAEIPLPIVPDVHMPDFSENPIPVYPVTPETSPVLPVTAAGTASSGIAPEQASLFPENEPVREPEQDLTAKITSLSEAGDVLPPELIKTPEAPAVSETKKEKADFGTAGLVFCLVIIGVLSVACGVLGILYFGGF
jgi:hypothetical protein